eukprot:7182157-Pyramimonas_sp.AAC.1
MALSFPQGLLGLFLSYYLIIATTHLREHSPDRLEGHFAVKFARLHGREQDLGVKVGGHGLRDLRQEARLTHAAVALDHHNLR